MRGLPPLGWSSRLEGPPWPVVPFIDLPSPAGLSVPLLLRGGRGRPPRSESEVGPGTLGP